MNYQPRTPLVSAHGAAPSTPPRIELEYICDYCWLSCSSERLLRSHNRRLFHLRNVQRNHEGRRPIRYVPVRRPYVGMVRDDIWDVIFELEGVGEVRYLPRDVWDARFRRSPFMTLLSPTNFIASNNEMIQPPIARLSDPSSDRSSHGMIEGLSSARSLDRSFNRCLAPSLTRSLALSIACSLDRSMNLNGLGLITVELERFLIYEC